MINQIMYMDDIQLSEKKWKKFWDPDTNNKDIQTGYRNLLVKNVIWW